MPHFSIHKWGEAIHCFELHDVRYPLPSLGWWACKLPDYRALGSRSLEICYDSIHHLSSNYVFAHSTDLLLRNTWGAQGARVYWCFLQKFSGPVLFRQIFNTISWGGQKGEIEKRKEGRRIYLFIGPAAGLLDPHLPYIYLDICLYTKHA